MGDDLSGAGGGQLSHHRTYRRCFAATDFEQDARVSAGLTAIPAGAERDGLP